MTEPKHDDSCAEWCNHCAVCGVGIRYGSLCPDHYQNQTCGAIGALVVAGREVGAFVCELDRGHGAEAWSEAWRLVLTDAERESMGKTLGAIDNARIGPTPHRASIEWTDASIDAMPDADLFDPDEVFDVTVPVPMPVACAHGDGVDYDFHADRWVCRACGHAELSPHVD